MVCYKLIAVPFNHSPVTGTVGVILVLFSSGKSSGTSLYKIRKKLKNKWKRVKVGTIENGKFPWKGNNRVTPLISN